MMMKKGLPGPAAARARLLSVHIDEDDGQQQEQGAEPAGRQQDADTGHQGVCYAAIIENRAREVGMALLDTTTLTLQLSQYIEPGRSYTTTLLCLDIACPQSVVVVAGAHDVFAAAGVNSAVGAAGFSQVPLGRSSFDDTRGIQQVESLASDATKPGAAVNGALHRSHYLAFGAAGALLHHLTHDRGLSLAAGSLQLEFGAATGQHMLLDAATIDALELVRPNTKGAPGGQRSGWGGRKSKQYSTASLLGFLDQTSTVPGARLLRTNVLQPLTSVATLEMRLDAVQELLESPHLSLQLVELLEQRLPKNLDKVCASLAIRQDRRGKDPARKIAALVEGVILLRDLLRALPELVDATPWVDSALLRAIRGNLQPEALSQLLQAIEETLDEETQASKAPFASKIQQCFAVKANVDSFLDLARATFCRLTESVHELADKYRAAYGQQGQQGQQGPIKVSYSHKKGFYLVVPEQGSASAGAGAKKRGHQGSGASDGWELPKSFLVLEKRGRNAVCCTTHELNALNARLRDAAADCMLLTEQVLEKLVSTVVAQMPLLLKVVDNIALLDMLLAFFSAISGSSGEYVRPLISQQGPLAITQGRHPLVERLARVDYVPNDTYISSTSSLHIITGPNMAGKSTYLKQVALIAIMTQIGCYVPAHFCSIRPFDRLLTRIGTADSIEANASSFMVEMQEMAVILDSATDRSLVLIDELGRATSTTDGVGIAWAMCEWLIALGAFALVATHFRRLEELATLYPSCRLWHMQVDVEGDHLDYLWQLAPFRAQAAGGAALHYGVMLAASAGIPDTIISRAREVAEALEAQELQRRAAVQVADAGGLAAIYSIMHKLSCVAGKVVLEGDGEQGDGNQEEQAQRRLTPQVLALLQDLKREAERAVSAQTTA